MIPFFLFFILAGLLTLKKIGSYDLGFHLAAGRILWDQHRVPRQDTWTWGSPGAGYLDPHWLFQALLYKARQWGGFPGISVLDLLLVLAVLYLLFKRLRTVGPSWVQLSLLLLALVGMERRFLPRPELWSWLFLSYELWVLESERRGLYWTLPFVFLLWANCEGLFPLGWAVLGFYLWKEGWGQWDGRLLRVFGASLAAPLLNPNFLSGWFFPLTLWERLQDPLYHRTISEFQAPLLVLAQENLHIDPHAHILAFLFLALLGTLLVLVTFPQRKAHELLLFVVFGGLGWTAVRNIPLFFLAVTPLVGRCFRDWEAKPRWGWLHGWPAVAVFSLLILGFSTRVLTNAYYIQDRRLDRFGWDLDPERLPIRSAGFIRDQKLDGPILNSLNFGGWLDLELPGRAFIDGRLEVPSREAFQAYEDSFKPDGLAPLLDRTKPSLILVEYNAAMPWVDQLRTLTSWELIYLDENSALYAPSDTAKGVRPFSFQDLETERGLRNLSEQEWTRTIPAPGTRPWFSGFLSPREYPMGLFSLGLFSLRAGAYGTAQDFFGNGLLRTGPGFSETYYNLGVASLHLGQTALGKLCLEETLRLDGSNEAARTMLRSLP